MTERIVTGSNGRKYITNEPLLRSPHQQWVALTDDEIDTLSVLAGFDPTHKDELMRVRSVVKAILRLKEKNGL